MSNRWHRAIAELSAQGDAARAAVQRVQDVPSGQRTTAVAISYATETGYLRSASTLLRAHLTDRRPPRRLLVAHVWPCLRDVWRDRALDRLGGVWQAVPRDAALARMRSAPSDPLLTAAINQAEALQASLRGDRRVDRLYESYSPDRTDGCLAASPYRHDAVRAMVDDGVLTLTPVEGGTTLRLGPAEDGGTHPLRPLDRATLAVLDEYGC